MKSPGAKDRCEEFDWLAEFECSEREQVDEWSGLSASERTKIERLEAEVWGLLPCVEDPVAPSQKCKERLMRRIAASPVALMPSAPQSRSRAPRWLMPLAAGLTVLAVGLAAAMFSTVRAQRGELDELRARVAELDRVAAMSTDLEIGLAAAQEKLELVSQRGVGICALRPALSGGDEADSPYGLLFVAADHQHWYVRVEGLEAAPDKYYRVWFETEDGSLIAAGNLIGSELELSAPTMPEGTRAVHVSLEHEPEPAEPSDQIVLFGDDMIEVL